MAYSSKILFSISLIFFIIAQQESNIYTNDVGQEKNDPNNHIDFKSDNSNSKTKQNISIDSENMQQRKNQPSNIIEMTNLTFHETLNNNSVILVLYYSSSCPYCQIFFPKYQNISMKFSNFPITQIDVDKYEDIGEEFKINEYPTLILYNHKNQYEYDGVFNETDIITFLEDKTAPIYSIVNKNEINQTLSTKNPYIILYIGNIQEKEFLCLNDFLESRNRERFLVIEKSQFNFKNNQINSKLKIYKKFDEREVFFTDTFNSENLKLFFDRNLFPNIMYLNNDTISLLKRESKNGLIVFNDEEKSKNFNFNINEFLITLAKQYKPEILFFICDFRTNFHSYFGLQKQDFPRVEIIKFSDSKLKRYYMNNTFSQDNINQFIIDYLNNKIARFYKSASISKTSGPVLKLVGKNYFENVMNEKNDVMVKFFDPKCKHCKQLAPIYADLARNIGKTEGIVIAELDITENEIPGIEITKIPTIFFYPANNKSNPIKYSGEKEYSGLLEFLFEKCTKEHIKYLKEELMPDL